MGGEVVHLPLLSRGLGLLACVFMVLSAVFFQPATGGAFLKEAAALMLLGMAALWGALWRYERSGRGEPPVRPNAPSQSFPRLNGLRWLALGILYLAVLAEISGRLLDSPYLANVSHHVQFVLFVAGIVLVTWGIGGRSLDSDETASLPLSIVWRGGRGVRYDFWLIVLITLLAFAVRFWQLGDAVHHFVDEIHFSTAVAHFWLAPEDNVELLAPFGSITAFPWLYPYVQAGAVAILGRNLEGLRAVSAALGALTIPALYLLARTLFDRKTALIAALVLATFPPHVNFSRIGLNNVADPLFGTLGLAFLARGLKSGRRMDFAIAGTAAGLTQYFYEGGRFLFVFLFCLWLIGYLLVGRRDARSSHAQRGEVRQGIVVFILTAFIVAAPVYYTLYALQRPFAPRMDIVGVGGSYWLRAVGSGGGQTFDQHILMPLLTFVFMPEQALYYAGDQPMVLSVFVPVFLLGAAYALWRWRGAGMPLALWVLLTAAGNSLMTYGAIYARYVVVFPALALLIALGVRQVAPLILPTRIYRRYGTAILALAAIAIAAVQTAYYFGPHLTDYNWRIRPHADEQDALFRSVGFPPGTRIHLITPVSHDTAYVYGVLGYLADHLSITIVHPDEVTDDYLYGLSRRIDHAFFVEPDDRRTPELLAQHFNLQPPQYSPFNVPRERQFTLYYAPRLWSPGG